MILDNTARFGRAIVLNTRTERSGFWIRTIHPQLGYPNGLIEGKPGDYCKQSKVKDPNAATVSSTSVKIIRRAVAGSLFIGPGQRDRTD
jgi:hypothetical protein